MFFPMFFTKITAFFLFVNTFDTQPLRRLTAFLADKFWHPIARQQDNWMFSGRFSFPEPHHFDIGLGCGAKVI
jgi:hypothetical protein